MSEHKYRVAYVGPFGKNSGYGIACLGNILSLLKAGADVSIWPVKGIDTDELDPEWRDLVPHIHKQIDATHVVMHWPPHEIATLAEQFGDPFFSKFSVPTIGLTTWEYDTVPDKIAKGLSDKFDLIGVPMARCKNAFGDKGVLNKNRICILGHAADPAIIPRQRIPDGTKRFYSMLNWSDRKNPVGIVEAYFAAFWNHKDVDKVKLTIWIDYFDPVVLQMLRQVPGKYPALEIIQKSPSSRADVLAFHRDNDIYVDASRGESWNLPAFEAVCTGNELLFPFEMQYPYASQGFGGAYANTKCLVRHLLHKSEVKNGPQGAFLDVKWKQAEGATPGMTWLEPSLYSLAGKMQTVEVDERSLERGKIVVEKFSQENTGKAFLRLLDQASQTRRENEK